MEPGAARTAAGGVRAKFVVRATEAYTVSVARQRRVMLPLSSCMLATEVLSPNTWAGLGWEEAETMLDGARRYVYIQRTGDVRIAIGGAVVPHREGCMNQGACLPTLRGISGPRADGAESVATP